MLSKLSARLGFLEGMSRLFDFSGNLSVSRDILSVSDEEALRGDWDHVIRRDNHISGRNKRVERRTHD